MVTVRPQKVIDDDYVSQSSYTIDLDLPTSGILSTLDLYVKARTITTGAEPNAFIKYLISSITLNEGGQAFLCAARPEAFQADSYYKTGKMPRNGYDVMGGAAAEIVEHVPILLGNKRNDLEHTIDLSTLSDPKLSVTYNLATTGIQGQTVWATGYYPRFTVIANFLGGPDLPVSKGYHSLRAIEQYTPTDNQIKKVQLTGVRPIKRIYAQLDITLATYGWIHSLDEIKLEGDNEAYVPFIQKPDDWYELIRNHFGLCEVFTDSWYTLSAKFIETCIDKRLYYNTQQILNLIIRSILYGGSGRHVILRHYTASTGVEDTSTVCAIRNHYVGYVPWTIGIIDMPKMLGLDYLDPTLHKPVYLTLDHVSNAATIGGPVRIYVSDLVKPGS